MTLKDLLRKKKSVQEDTPQSERNDSNVPEFTFMRTTTSTQEIITPPLYPGDNSLMSKDQKHQSIFSRTSPRRSGELSPRPKSERRLSDRLHISHRSRSASSSSILVPEDLPEVDQAVASSEEGQAQWEKRATILVKGTSLAISPNSLANEDSSQSGVSSSNIGNTSGDENIQEAIRLHEAGDLENSTQMFGVLANPQGSNNALSQVLYGLALRHGWGCEPNPELAITYLTYAASNSAEIESLALAAGMKKGGTAKGELILAIFELANCFRNGWGVKKDAFAAKQYYETAANLGDTDAMNEVAWCYLEGFGCKKDKFRAAQFLRLAEDKGNKTLGNSWIWKEKYNPKN